jgi:AcrR family transcriptional regulator
MYAYESNQAGSGEQARRVDLRGRSSNSYGMKVTKTAQTAATRSKLEAVARALFAERGFEAVSAEELVAKAEVTRGALYHHYDGKEGLFAAVVETVMAELHAELVRETAALADPLLALERGIGVFLKACSEPSTQRILLVDAPAVLGWQRWREMDAKYGLGLIRQALSAAVSMGLLEKRDVDVLAHLLLGSLTEAAMMIARSPNPPKARKAAERALASMIEGCRVK